ncbi:MAG: tyrosine-type recombinase/integrase [Streptosporangiaceae bacterium]
MIFTDGRESTAAGSRILAAQNVSSRRLTILRGVGESPAHELAATAATSLLEFIPDRAVTADPYQTYLDTLDATTSRPTIRGCLDRIARIVIEQETGQPAASATGACRTWERIRHEHASHIRALLVAQQTDGESWSPSNVNKHLTALRQVLKAAWRLQLMSTDDYHRAADIPNLKGSRLPAGRSIRRDELAAMLQVCEDQGGPAGIRDAALISVLYSTGMRRAEAASARLDRYDPGERALRILGKGDKERLVYVITDAVPPLNRWLALLNTSAGPMFRTVDKHGHIGRGHLAPRTIGDIVDRVRVAAGLPPLDTHDFRRTVAGDLLDQGVDLATVQTLLGHSSPTTTAAYDRRPGRVARESADRLSLPATRRTEGQGAAHHE